MPRMYFCRRLGRCVFGNGNKDERCHTASAARPLDSETPDRDVSLDLAVAMDLNDLIVIRSGSRRNASHCAQTSRVGVT